MWRSWAHNQGQTGHQPRQRMPRDHPKKRQTHLERISQKTTNSFICVHVALMSATLRLDRAPTKAAKAARPPKKRQTHLERLSQKTTNLFRRVHYLNLTVMPTPTTNKHDKNQLIHLDLTYSEKILKLAYKLLFFFLSKIQMRRVIKRS